MIVTNTLGCVIFRHSGCTTLVNNRFKCKEDWKSKHNYWKKKKYEMWKERKRHKICKTLFNNGSCMMNATIFSAHMARWIYVNYICCCCSAGWWPYWSVAFNFFRVHALYTLYKSITSMHKESIIKWFDEKTCILATIITVGDFFSSIYMKIT